jgi:hypothetical protein
VAIEAKAKVKVEGGSEALKTIQGVQRATRQAGAEATKAARESERASTKAAREQQKAARESERASKNASRAEEKKAKDVERSAKKQADAQIREAKRAERELERIQQREERRWRQLAENSARVREQAEQRTARTRERYSSTALRGGARFLGAATAGVLAGGVVAAGTARSIAGVQDVSERVRRANTFQESLIITGTQAGVSRDKRNEIQSRVLTAAEQSGIDPLELAGALESAQKQFNGFEKFAGIIDELALTAKSSGSNVQELTSALGFIAQANNLTSAEDMVEALNLIVAAAAKGSVEVDNFARDFAASAGIFATNTGQTGIAGVRQFLGVSQGVATGGFGSAESATRVERFAADLQDKNVAAGLAKLDRGKGVKLRGADGTIDIGSVLDQLAASKDFRKASVRQGIFKEVRALQAVEALMAARGRVQAGDNPNAVDFQTIAAVDAKAGSDLTKATFRELEESGALALQREAIRMQNDTIENLAKYNAQVLLVTKASNDLEKALGSLSLWASSIGAAGAGAAGAAALGALGSGGAAAGVGAGAAGAGAAAGGAGILATGAAVIGAGAAGYFGAKALGADAAGEGIGNFFADLAYGGRNDVLRGGSVDFSKLERNSSSKEASAAASERANGPVVSELRTLNKGIKTLVEQVERRPAPPLNQPARSPR